MTDKSETEKLRALAREARKLGPLVAADFVMGKWPPKKDGLVEDAPSPSSVD